MKSTVKIYEGEVQSEITVEEFDKRKQNGEKFIKPEGMESYVLVSVYFEIMRPIWREDKKEQRSYECMHRKYCTFDGCDGCIRREYISDSLEFVMKKGGIGLPSTESAEETFVKNLLYRELQESMNELDETDKKILEMSMDSESERTIAEKLGFNSKTSIRKRKEKITLNLKEKLEKFF